MKDSLVPILYNKGLVTFLINITTEEKYLKYHMKFEVYEVDSWVGDTPSDMTLYLGGSIKWDGCSHIWFGEKDEEGKRDGYLHLCGKEFWQRHADLMIAIYELAENTIPEFDRELS